jgi:Flp pilus assembly protein TadD
MALVPDLAGADPRHRPARVSALCRPAIPHFLEAAKSPYSEGKAHRYLGFTYYSLGKPSETIPYFREAVRLDPKDPQGYNALGVALEQTGASTEALEAYRSAATLDPSWTVPKANASRLELRLGR